MKNQTISCHFLMPYFKNVDCDLLPFLLLSFTHCEIVKYLLNNITSSSTFDTLQDICFQNFHIVKVVTFLPIFPSVKETISLIFSNFFIGNLCLNKISVSMDYNWVF